MVALQWMHDHNCITMSAWPCLHYNEYMTMVALQRVYDHGCITMDA